MRRAYTLVELLVAIAILAALIAMGVAAMQKVRDRAARIECVNKLKQIGLALQAYHEREDSFPPAHTTPGEAFGCPRPYDRKTYFAWMTRILPYLEQQPLYDQINWNAWPWWQHPINETVLDVYRCNADARANPYLANYGGRDPVALAGYMGVSGTDQLAFDGILYANSRVAVDSISDGASNTLLVGERPPSQDLVYGWWFAGSGDYPYFGATDVVLGTNEVKSVFAPQVRDVYREGTIVDPANEHRWHFWSLHNGGSNFLFVDGSVRFLSYDVGQDVLNSLATRAGGEVLTIPLGW